MYNKLCLIMFYVFRFLGWFVLITIFPFICFFSIRSAFHCSILKAIIIDIISFIALYAIIALIVAIVYCIAKGYNLYLEKEAEKRSRGE